MEQKYCAFISYRHVSPDSEIAKSLHTAIETYGIPGSIKKLTGRKAMGKVFRDQEELPLSADLGADIEAALEKSDWLICVCSPRYLESRWCLREVEYFIQHKGRDRILAVLAEGEPEDSFPEALLRETMEDGRVLEREPLAADLRGATPAESRKKLRTEALRLLAPMLGVSYDDLKRRARQRRIRQTAAACAAFLVLAGGITAYAIGNHAKNERLRLEAEEQQRIALEQQQLAEERKRQADEEAKRAEEEKARAEEEAKRAEAEKAKAEEEAKRAEEERLRAVSNSIGELLERASAHLDGEERRLAAAELLEALDLSDAEGGLRREEIVSLLRTDLYIPPFASVSGFSNQNVRLNDIVPAPGGRLAAGIENGNRAALIDLETNDIRYRVSVGNGQILSLCFSPDGERFLANCDQGRLVTVWNTADGSEAFRYVSKADHEYHIANACFWKDGDHLLVQDMDRFLLVSRDGTEKLIYTIGEQQDWYSEEENILTWLFETPLEELFTLNNTEDYTGTCMCVSEDFSRILVSGRDGSTGTVVLNGEGRLVCPLWIMPATFLERYSLSADGRLAACVSYLGFLAWWNTETEELVYIDGYDGTQGSSFCEIVFSPLGDQLAVAVNNELRIYDSETGDLLVSGATDPTSIVPDVAYSDDGSWLFLLNRDLFIIDARTGELYGMSEAGSAGNYSNAVQVGDYLFITRADGSAELLCMPALSNVRHLTRYTGTLCPEYDPSAAPKGVSLSLKGEHKLTDAFKQTTWLTDLSAKLFFDREGTRAALYYPDGVIELFDLEGDGTVSAMLGQLSREVSAFGMTEKYLAACDAGGRFMLYDLEAQSVIHIYSSGFLYQRFAFSAGGDRLMALRSTGEIDVYDIPTAQGLFTLRCAGEFTDFAFASDGSAAVGITENGAEVATLWTDEAALIERARELAG